MAGRDEAPTAAGLLFSIITVLVLVVIALAAFRLFCSTLGQIVGYWTSPDGNLFEVSQCKSGPREGDYVVTTASRIRGASSDKMYTIIKKGCRSVSISFPGGALRGRIGFDRRRIIWDHAPTWYRQGV